MSHLPAMAPHAELSAWIESREELLSSALLGGEPGLCAVFLSCDDQGDYLLRLCDGADDRWMTWREQRRLRSGFGRSYAEAIANAALTRLERGGWQLEWMARTAPAALPALAA
ncbi:hypothetical protein D0B54_23920 [Solimonas sp. K1W22B-7]|uniref:hypothetical protein n=1 Tax=Solimonas sp. K1W22B-7 TaxID=2303331 RepID=UPI000E334ECC|nr:hypothetical protein [Solimonas sp. K1W22B-7]AXQ31546.1 hypothetical protein D0B54_23920 [Solimonas sp. K1W22B-7]